MIATMPSSQCQLVRPEVASSFCPVYMREGGRDGRMKGGIEGGRH